VVLKIRFCCIQESIIAMYTGPDGKEYIRKVGNRQEVWDEVVYCTSGKLLKSHLVMKNNKLVSKRRSELGKKRFAERNPFRQEEEKITKSQEVVDEVAEKKPAAKPEKPDGALRPRPLKRRRKRRRH
jgi:hypothetical protein